MTTAADVDIQPRPGASARRIAVDLLTLLTTRRAPAADIMQSWTDADLAQVRRLVRQHRIAPLLHWRLAREHAHVQVPEPFRDELAQSFRRAARRAVQLQAELHGVHRMLEAAGIPHVVLKGPFLATHAYPHAALRTMRDLDVLVPLGDARHAFDLLIAGGCTRPAHLGGDPQAFLDGNKHLPPLLTASGRVLLEVHGRLIKPDEVSRDGMGTLDEDAVWARCVTRPFAGTELSFLSPTDLLLHLAVHASYDHRFDNGPLIFSDVAYLLERHAIDWPLFWSLAARGHWTRGAQIVLRMTAAWYVLPAEASAACDLGHGDDDSLLDELADEAALLTLRDVDRERDQRFLRAVDNASGPWARTRLLLGRAFPSRQSIAAQFPVRADSPAIALGYVRRWFYLGRRSVAIWRAQRAVAESRRDEQREARRRLEALERWLRGRC